MGEGRGDRRKRDKGYKVKGMGRARELGILFLLFLLILPLFNGTGIRGWWV